MAVKGAILVTYDEDEAEQLYNDGATLRELAERYGCSARTIRVRLLKRGAKMHGNYKKAYGFDWLKVAKEYKNGWTHARLARKYHVSTPTISAHLRDMGVPTRRKWIRQRFGTKVCCSRCGLVLEQMTYHIDGLCCYCIALEQGKEIGAWVWADSQQSKEEVCDGIDE